MKLASILLFAVFTAILQRGSSTEQGAPSEFDVSITVNYTPPLTFDRQPPYYRAGSAISLSCEVEGVSADGLFYEWRSTCAGNCFAARQTASTVKTQYLHSYDSGVHTCIVYDGLGCSGNVSTTVNVVGAGFHVSAGQQSLPNNSLILGGVDGRISEFRCLSGSGSPDVGQLISPRNEDITFDDSDSFLVRKGGRYDPGLVHVRRVVPLEPEEQGVYTCRIPDERGVTVDVNVGLYLKDSAVPPAIANVEYGLNSEGLYILTCTSEGSPPTSVTWTRNGNIIPKNDTMYNSTQLLVDRNNTVYKNLLIVGGSFEDAIGEYSCMVENTLGVSDVVNKTIKAIEISGHNTPVIVGLSGGINCSTLLNVSKMEWYIKGFDDPVESGTGVNSLTLTLTPDSTALNGTSVICQAYATSGEVYQERVNIIVKELENSVRLEGPDNPLLAGGEYVITCVVRSDLIPEVKWRDGAGNDIPQRSEEESESLSGVVVVKEETVGHTTKLKLSFRSLLTSQGGTYSCLSIVAVLSSTQISARDVIVKIPPPAVRIVHRPERAQLFTTDNLDLICLSSVNLAVDTSVGVSMTWLGQSGMAIVNDSRVHVVGMEGAILEYDSTLRFSSLQSTDSGSYTCSSTAAPFQASPYIVQSETASAATSVTAALKTNIVIDYTPPDQYPDYAPPNYRAASSVTLRCSTEGASGSVSYRWSSTCGSCFASSSTSSSISEDILKSRDSGVHTCSTTDSVGNVGNTSITMNIVGAGVYVMRSVSYGGGQNAQPNDSYVVVDTGNNRHSDYIRLELYCCSNSTANGVGSFTFPDGTARSSNYDHFRITRFSSSHTYAGCIYMDIYYYEQRQHCYYRSNGWYNTEYVCDTVPDVNFVLASSQRGVYTCSVPDSSGTTKNINFGLYPEGSRSISVPQLLATTSTTVPTLTCNTNNIPPTEVSWQKDGHDIMELNDTTTEAVKYITVRTSSSYSTSLSLYTHIENVIGNYTCTAGNTHSTRTSQTLSLKGIEANLTSSNLTVGGYVKFECSSDLDPQSIVWSRNGSSIFNKSGSSSELVLDPVSTDDEGMLFSCAVISPYGSQGRNETLNTLVPNNWARVSTTKDAWQNPFHGDNYTITCTVNIIKGMDLPPTIQWYHLNGSLLENGHRVIITSNKPRITSTWVTRSVSLTFAPVLTEDGGEYSCQAQVTVPWMSEQPQMHSSSVNVIVKTQAKFQLKLGPLPHCSTWELDAANNLQSSIKNEITAAIRYRCSCNLNWNTYDWTRSWYTIHSGEFSCQTTTTDVVYRAIINGRSDHHTADELLEYLDDWRKNDQTLLHNNMFRLRMSQECPLKIESFSEIECKNDNKKAEDKEVEGSKHREGVLIDSGSCYRFQACDQSESIMPDSSTSGDFI